VPSRNSLPLPVSSLQRFTVEVGRKGGLLRGSKTTFKLHGRIREHARSIEEATNLDIEHFFFRCLVVDDIWIPLGEALMIDTFTPLWNTLIDGFGIHTPDFNGFAWVACAKLLIFRD